MTTRHDDPAPPTRKQRRLYQGKLAARRLLVLQMRHKGHSFRHIGEVNRTHHSVAQDDYAAAMREWATPLADLARETEAERLDALQVACWSAAIGGDLQAIDRALKIMARRAKLLGLDEPRKVDVTALIEKAALEAGVDPEEVLREADEIIRRVGF